MGKLLTSDDEEDSDDERTEALRREVDVFRRFIEKGVDPELEKLLIERVAIAELELQIIALRQPHMLH